MQTYPPGTRIGQYEIVSLPMMGGMGVVYFALDHGNDGRPVALKTFRPELLPDRAARDRFLREGTAWVELGNHPNIVRCYEALYIEPIVFLVLELIAQEKELPDASLRSWMRFKHILDTEQAILFALQIAKGMQHACQKIPGFAHRDLKPENVLVGVDKIPKTNINRIRVTDFGLVRLLEGFYESIELGHEKLVDGEPTITDGSQTCLTLGVAGTPLYMAPEQWEEKPVGVFTDIYALGCILYEMLAGYPAALGSSIAELRASHCSGNLRPFPEGLPQNIYLFLKQCLDLHPARRYNDWETVLATLETTYRANGGQHFPQFADVTASIVNDQIQYGRSYSALGSSYLHLGRIQVAINYFEKALKVFRKNQDLSGEAAELGNLGQAHYQLGNTKLAIDLFQQCLAAQGIINNRDGESSALRDLAMAYVDLGKSNEAKQYLQQALKITREIGDRQHEGMILGNLGIVFHHLGNNSRSLQFYKQGLEIDREVGNRRGEGNNLGNLANVYRSMNKLRESISCSEQAIIIAREVGDRRGEANSLGNLGISWKELGDFDLSITYFEECLKVHQEIGDQRGQINAIESLGNVYKKMGKVRESISYYQNILGIISELGDKFMVGEILKNIGSAYEDLGDMPQAIMYYEQSLSIHQETGNRKGEEVLLGMLGLVHHQRGDHEQAIRYYEKYIVIAHDLGDPFSEGAGLANMGLLYFNMGNSQRALIYYQQALTIRREIGDLNGIGTDLYNMATLFGLEGDSERAISLAQEAIENFSRIPNNQKVQQTQALIAEIQEKETGDASQIIQESFDAFRQASSAEEMRFVVGRYPFMTQWDLIQFFEQIINENIPIQDRLGYEQRLAILRQIASGK
jgi:tetratricopeptide (TPR) repeat protein